MAAWYWDGYGTSGTYGTGSGRTMWSSATGDAGYYSGTGTVGTGGGFYYSACSPVVTIRKFLISPPEHWTDSDADAFVRLLNIETRTGFKVEMLIRGDVCITDPTIEKRAMADFVPLLLSRACGEDHEKVQSFFVTHPLEVPPSSASGC